jgi:hypothetical protein
MDTILLGRVHSSSSLCASSSPTRPMHAASSAHTCRSPASSTGNRLLLPCAMHCLDPPSSINSVPGPHCPHLHSSPLCLAQGVVPTLRFPQHMTCCTPPKHLVDDGIDTTPPSSVRSIRDAIQRQLWPGTRAFPPTVVATTVHSLVPLSVSAKGLHSLRALQLAGAHRQRLGPPGHLRRVRTPLATAVLAATVDAAAR